MRTGSRINLIAYPGQRFGRAVVVDPEVRIPRATRPGTTRHARLKCECGTLYLAQLSHLYGGRAKTCPGCASAEHGRKRRKPAGRAYKAQRGWCVVVYVGHFKSQAEAEDVARRSRAVVLPETTPITGI